MDHGAYKTSLKSKTPAMLDFIIADAKAAIDAMPDGENVGYYADEIHYAHAELKKRQWR
jgi:hypothetical protein